MTVLPRLTQRARRFGTYLTGLLLLAGVGTAITIRHNQGKPFIPESVSRFFADSGGSLASNPHCRLLSSAVEGSNTRNYYVCTRESGSTYKADELITPAPPTPTPPPPWLASCEVDTPSTIVTSAGSTRGTVGYYLTTDIGGPGLGAQFTNTSSVLYIDYTGNDRKWTNATDLVATIQNPENVPGRYTLTTTSPSTGGTSFSFILGANETKTLSFALQYYPGPWLAQYKWPGPYNIYESDPTITPVMHSNGSGTDVSQVSRFDIAPANTIAGWSNSVRVQSATKTCRPTNNFYGIMDQFGQLTGRGNFPNRVTSVADLRADAAQTQSSNLPWGASNQYLTPSSNPVVGANDGHWKFAKVNSKWTLVDPAGLETKIEGVNGIDGAPNAPSGQLSEILNYTDIVNADLSKFYTSLPDPAGLTYQAFRTISGKNGYPSPHFDASVANLALKYNTSDYLAAHLDRSTSRLRSWGVTTVVSPQAQIIAAGNIRTIEWLNLSDLSSYARLATPYGYMPDPFDAAFATTARAQADATVTKYAGHTDMNVGLYSDNEREWGNKTNAASRYNVAITTLKQSSSSAAKNAFQSALQTEYITIGALNTAWGKSYSSWADFLNQTNSSFATPPIGSTIGNDMDAFNLAYANKYFQTVKQQLDAAGYTGLYLGTRFRGNAYLDQTIAACVTYCDAVSVNIYTSNPGLTNPEFKALDKPVIISEYSLATPGGNGKQSGAYETPVSSSAEGALMNAYYSELQSWNNVVGTQWWEYMDESASGRFADGENLGFGLVSITDRPYTSTTANLTTQLVKMETQW